MGMMRSERCFRGGARTVWGLTALMFFTGPVETRSAFSSAVPDSERIGRNVEAVPLAGFGARAKNSEELPEELLPAVLQALRDRVPPDYAPNARDGRTEAKNPANGIEARFDEEGVHLRSVGEEGWRLNVRLTGFGR